MRTLWSLSFAQLRRLAFGTVAAVVLIAMAIAPFDVTPAQAGGVPWPFPLHLFQPPDQFLPAQQSPPAAQGSLTEFDAPGASSAFSTVCQSAFFYDIGCGTTPLDNNDVGDIVGTYTDAGLVQHGFLRYPNGYITSFEAPGAGVGPGQGTVAFAINDVGVIAGAFQDTNNVYHGFLRYPDGSFVTINAPGAGTVAQEGTLAFDVNFSGTTAGTYIDANDVNHGFVQGPGNSFVSFDPPGSDYTYPCEETCLTPNGTVTGFFTNEATGTAYGFVRTPNGAITTLAAPGAGTGPGFFGTIAASINPAGVVTGYYIVPSGTNYGFVWYPGGSFVTFSDPGSGTTLGTDPLSINAAGATAGSYFDATGLHGFERDATGQFANFSAYDPGGVGTRVTTNNAWGEVTGWYIDADDVDHGFVWQP